MSHRTITKRCGKFLDVTVVPVRSDNYSYIIQCLGSRATAVVDVSQVRPVLAEIERRNVEPENVKAILTTHKHQDHCEGNKELCELYKAVRVYGGKLDHVPGCTHALADGDSFALGDLTVNAIHTPCHTKGHLLYHVFHPDDPGNGAVFTGDTIFVAGIGAFFEGNAADMLAACSKFTALPDATSVFCGHEYTMNFAKFAVSVDKDNKAVSQAYKDFEGLRAQGLPTVPSTVGAEKQINLFARCYDASLQKVTGISDPVKLMQHLYDTCP